MNLTGILSQQILSMQSEKTGTGADLKGETYADRMRSLGHLSRLAFRDFATALGGRLARHGVTSGQWRFLRVLWDEDGISQRQLADRVGTREATAVRSIRSLVTHGLVERREDRADARKYLIVLTPKARRLEHVLLPYVAEVHEIAERGIPRRDLETTRRVLRQVHENLRAHAAADVRAFDEDRLA